MSVLVAPSGAGIFSYSMTGVEETQRGLDVAGALVRKALEDALYEIAKDIVVMAQGRIPNNRSGWLSQSGSVDVPEATLDEIAIALGFQARYAAFRDQGGTIVPVRADVLAIPQAPILDGNGSSIYANPRQEPKLFVFRWIGRDGQPKAGLAMKVDGKIEIHWVFADSVTQQGSKFFTGTIADRAPQVGALAAQLMRDVIKGSAA